MMMLALGLLVSLFMTPQEASQAARVDALFKDYDSPASPGCAMAVFRDGAILYQRAYGMANLDHDVRLSTESVFHVASLSKQFTAASILLLAQDGKLALDDDIRKYVPEVPDFGRKIFLPAGLLAPVTTPPGPDDSAEVPLPAERLARFAGLYWNEKYSVVRRFVLEAGRLHLLLGGQRIPLKSLGAGAFAMTTAPWTRLSFTENPAGGVQLKADQDLELVRMDPFEPTQKELAAYVGVYRSDEMDTVFRISMKDGRLQLVRTKLPASSVDPLFRDTFQIPSFAMHFSRNSAGRVIGFQLEGGRILHLKFWKDTSPRSPI